jgi:DNA-binding CsgD family transcriptional regulator
MNDRIDAIYALWEELADFPMGEGDAALLHLLAALCDMLGAQNAIWSALVRLPTPAAGDLLEGWRPRLVRLLNPVPAMAESVRQRMDQLCSPDVDQSQRLAVSGGAPFRTWLLSEGLPPDWFDGAYYRRHYLGIGLADSLSLRWALNDDVRVHLTLLRSAAAPRFSAEDKAPLALAMRGLKWFLRRQLLGHGLLIASTPLSPTERQVLLALLGGRVEKQIAQDLAQSAHTTHVQVKSIYSKFGVTKRSALTALWLGRLR